MPSSWRRPVAVTSSPGSTSCAATRSRSIAWPSSSSGTPTLAEEATQSTFVRACRALPSLGEGHGLLPWLFRIAAGEARQQRRDSGRPRHTSRPVERIRGPHYPASAVAGLAAGAGLSHLERERVSEAFDRLGEEDRLTIASRYLFGLSRADAASALAISANVLDAQLRTALQHLRARMTAA